MTQDIKNAIAELSPEMVAAGLDLADEDAKRLCAYLNPKNRIKIPLEKMTGLAAALRVQALQKNGLFQFLAPCTELSVAYENFMANFTSKDAIWRESTVAPLSRQVFKSWVRNFAWSAPKELGGECLMQASEYVSDVEVAAIAKMLWQFKHSCSRN